MKPTIAERIEHIRQAIDDIRDLLAGKTSSDFTADRHARAAAERYIEIISEASRHIPETAKDRYPAIPWKDIAGIGNVLRHEYHKVMPKYVWETYRRDLDMLLVVIEAISRDTDTN